MDSLKLTFGPKSALVRFLKKDKDDRLPWKPVDDSVVLEFSDDPNSVLKPWSANFLAGLIEHRSPYFAESTLSNISFALSHDLKIPRKQKLLLADALDRVRAGELSEGISCVKFLYGPQEKQGRPEKEILEKFLIYQLIESSYSAIGRLSSSNDGKVGAYEITKHLLESEKIFMDEDALKGIRDQVRKKTSNDLNYMLQFVHFLVSKGYRANQIM